MEKQVLKQTDFKTYRKSALRAYKLLLEDLKSRGDAPLRELERTACITTYRMLFFLAAGCRGMMDIPDFKKSPRPFMQNIHRWVRDNPPHARRYFTYSDLFEPSKQPYLWKVHPSDQKIKEAVNILMETEPDKWRANWPGAIYPEFLDVADRKETGSFYTPDPVVDYIVAQSLGPLCYRSPERKKGPRSPEDILAIRVLDPAMGDGRFLLAAFDYLSEALSASKGKSIGRGLRADIAANCLYGVDQDKMVVDIARIALWLHLGLNDVESSFLKRHFQQGDSLLGATLEELDRSLEDMSFDESQMGLFKPEVVYDDDAVSLKKLAEGGRMIERIRLLAHLWTSILMENEDELEFFSLARASLSRASDERWGEIEAQPVMHKASLLAEKHSFFHWELRFPEVFFPRDGRIGGFDSVIGNPPYRKERGYGENILPRASSVSREWGEGKMDMIALFTHRALDLLKRGGRLCFITSSYWLHAEGARRLRERLVRKENLIAFVDLGAARVFPGLSGRHCIFSMAKGGRHPNPVGIFTIKAEYEKTRDAVDKLSGKLSDGFNFFEIGDQRNLLDDNGDFHLGDRDVEILCRRMEKNSVPLGELVRSSQGVVDNPPKLNERILSKLEETQPGKVEEMGYEPGEPVFVIPLNHPLVEELDDSERKLLRPFYRTSSIRPFALPAEPDAYILYLTSKTCPDIDKFPNLRKHLERFRPVMEMRREVKKGSIRWWHLHWSRDEKLFEGEHLLIPQMADSPTAARARSAAYSGISTNLVEGPAGISLKFIEAVINSGAVHFWMDEGRRAKRRGANIDITLATLRKLPVPYAGKISEAKLMEVVDELMEIYEKACGENT